jgi:hypothetical protein
VKPQPLPEVHFSYNFQLIDGVIFNLGEDDAARNAVDGGFEEQTFAIALRRAGAQSNFFLQQFPLLRAFFIEAQVQRPQIRVESEFLMHLLLNPREREEFSAFPMSREELADESYLLHSDTHAEKLEILRMLSLFFQPLGDFLQNWVSRDVYDWNNHLLLRLDGRLKLRHQRVTHERPVDSSAVEQRLRHRLVPCGQREVQEDDAVDPVEPRELAAGDDGREPRDFFGVREFGFLHDDDFFERFIPDRNVSVAHPTTHRV